MSIKSVVNAAVGFDRAVAKSAAEAAIAFGETCWNTFSSDDIDKETMTALLDGIEAESTWRGTSSAAARRSEWKAAITAVPFYFIEACRYFKSKYPVGFNRVVMFRLARMLPAAIDYKAAVDSIYADATVKAATKAVAGGKRTVEGLLKSLLTFETRKKSEREFIRELAKLCGKHGYNVGDLS